MLNYAFEEQLNLKYEIDKSKESVKPNKKKADKKEQKALTFYNTRRLLKEIQKAINVFKSIILPIKKQTYGNGIKILTPKQTLQRLPTALAQVKAGNTSKNLLNVIWQIKGNEVVPKI